MHVDSEIGYLHDAQLVSSTVDLAAMPAFDDSVLGNAELATCRLGRASLPLRVRQKESHVPFRRAAVSAQRREGAAARANDGTNHATSSIGSDAMDVDGTGSSNTTTTATDATADVAGNSVLQRAVSIVPHTPQAVISITILHPCTGAKFQVLFFVGVVPSSHNILLHGM